MPENDDAPVPDSQKTTELRKRVGRRVTEARQNCPGELSQSQHFAKRIGVKESLLSMYETGSRPIPSDLLPVIADAAEVTVEHLLGMKPIQEESAGHPFDTTIEFLTQATELGVDAIFPNRDTALFHLCPFLDRMSHGHVCITGSSLKGLQLDANHEFVRHLKRISERKNITVCVILTHPLDGYSREKLENRTEGSIVSEIFQGIRWCREQLHVDTENIRFMRSSPTIFSIFLEQDHAAIGLLNPYPMMGQAYPAFALIVRRVDRAKGVRTHPIYQTYSMSNFHEPWQDNSGKITVKLAKMISDCSNAAGLEATKQELLNRELRLLRDTELFRDVFASEPATTR